MAEVFSLWMVATKSIFHKWTVDGKLSPSFVGQHIGLSSDPEKAVEYANNHMISLYGVLMNRRVAN